MAHRIGDYREVTVPDGPFTQTLVIRFDGYALDRNGGRVESCWTVTDGDTNSGLWRIGDRFAYYVGADVDACDYCDRPVGTVDRIYVRGNLRHVCHRCQGPAPLSTLAAGMVSA